MEEENIKIEIKLDGKTHTFNMSEEDTILEAGERHGLDIPFSCRSGICGTCKARLLEGKVSMDENEVLNESDVSEGFVLLCQSHPETSRVKVTMDF